MDLVITKSTQYHCAICSYFLYPSPKFLVEDCGTFVTFLLTRTHAAILGDPDGINLDDTESLVQLFWRDG